MFEERYCRALRQLASSLSVGLTIRQAVSDLCTNPFIHSSIVAEFKQIDAEIKALEDAEAEADEEILLEKPVSIAINKIAAEKELI